MDGLKTRRNRASVNAFLARIKDEQQRRDAMVILRIMQDATGEKPTMWGRSLIGFGSYHYKYASGREGDWFLTGFSPRKGSLSLYLMSGLRHRTELLGKLGKYKTGVGCLYIKRLEDIHLPTLKKLIGVSVEAMRKPRI